jgi:nucleotide-binding universal stress UspA family protein
MMNTDTTSLVVIDPSTEFGEAALDLIEVGPRVTLFLMLSGPSAGALEAFAKNEGISISEAGDIYLDQVSSRLRRTGVKVEAWSSTGDDPVEELLEAVEQTDAARVAVPASSRMFGRRGLSELAKYSTVPVMVAPAA